MVLQKRLIPSPSVNYISENVLHVCAGKDGEAGDKIES